MWSIDGMLFVMNQIVFNVALVVAFVLVGGYFAASELALVSLRESQVARLAARGRRGERVAKLWRDSNRFLAAVQIGVTLAGFFSAAYGGSTLTLPLAGVLTGWGMSTGPASTVALVAVTGAISYLSLVLGELVPKRLALQRAERVSVFVAPVVDLLASLSRPIIWLLSRSTDMLVRVLGLDPRATQEQVSEEELRDMIVANEELNEEERRVLHDVFRATDRQLSEVMVPRTEVDFLRADTPLLAAAADVVTGARSRFPVYDENIDDVVGFVHVRDLLTALTAPHRRATATTGGEGDRRDGEVEALTVRDIVRPVTLLPGSRPLLSALSQMRQSGIHLAVIVDEYGGTAGIVTLEDLIEELVGEIHDEYDLPEHSTAHPAGGARELDGLLHRDDIAEQAGVTLPDGPFETLAGYVQAQLGRIPRVGDTLEDLDHRFTVVEMSGRRAARIAITPSDATGPTTDGPP